MSLSVAVFPLAYAAIPLVYAAIGFVVGYTNIDNNVYYTFYLWPIFLIQSAYKRIKKWVLK